MLFHYDWISVPLVYTQVRMSLLNLLSETMLSSDDIKEMQEMAVCEHSPGGAAL